MFTYKTAHEYKIIVYNFRKIVLCTHNFGIKMPRSIFLQKGEKNVSCLEGREIRQPREMQARKTHYFHLFLLVSVSEE